ncbi:hypothetical protein AOA12_13410 [Microbacterium sp. No. 7]|nr:hypothetical protein AOA12_13410 [Microbacterium sp. No. 7]
MFAAVAIVHAVLVFAQPILAGMSLEGRDGALDLHYANGMAIMTVAAVQIVAALLWWKPGGGPARAIGVSAVLLVLEVVQFLIGSAGGFTLHLPLGIVLLLGAAAAAYLPFRQRDEIAA